MKKIFSLTILVLAIGTTRAQQAMTNSGNLQVHTGGVISGAGNFTNTSTAALVNNGTFYIKGNITNGQASMANSTGTLHLDGGTTQVIGGTQTFRTWNLVTNNSNGITLNTNLSVGGAHTFTSGIIHNIR